MEQPHDRRPYLPYCVLAALMLLTILVKVPFFEIPRAEGDEVDAQYLAASMYKGHYSLKRMHRSLMRPDNYVDSDWYHNPPLYFGIIALAALPRVYWQWSVNFYIITFTLALAMVVILFFLGWKVASWPVGALAGLLFLCCPLSTLIYGKLWAETLMAPLVATIVLVSLYLFETPSGGKRMRWRWITYCVMMLALMWVKQTAAVFLLYCLGLALIYRNQSKRRALQFLGISFAMVVVGFVSWNIILYVKTGHFIPVILRDSVEQMPVFVKMLKERHPLSFFSVPLTMMPLYLFACWKLPGRRLLPLQLYVAVVLAAMSALAFTTPIIYHMKYIAYVMPLVALCAACHLMKLCADRPKVFVPILALGLVYSGYISYHLTFVEPVLADVDLSYFFGAVGK